MNFNQDLSAYSRPTVARISLENVVHNYRTLKNLLPDSRAFYCPMIKADAYGHGDWQVLKTLREVGQNEFGVATLDEALELRAKFLREFAGQKVPDIFVFGPIFKEAVPTAIQNEFVLVISSFREIENLEAEVRRSRLLAPPRIHLKFNTGMARLGFDTSAASTLADHFLDHKFLKLEGVCTHLSDGDDAHLADGVSQKQFELFSQIENAFSSFELKFHALNSSALIATAFTENHRARRWGARPGIALYGVKPALVNAPPEIEAKWRALDLRPVMTVETKIVLTRPLKKGDGVSYNRRWTSPGDSLVAVLPIGYADGYHRTLSNKGRMLLNDKSIPVVGTVCMDYTLVNVTALRENNEDLYGMRVVVLGRDQENFIHAEELAELAGTNSYEILTSISRRVPRTYR